jgi:hypothetical protein
LLFFKEPFAFGGLNPSNLDTDKLLVDFEKPVVPYSVLNLTADSSFFIAGFTESYLPKFMDLYMDTNYWSTHDSKLEQNNFLMGDGGILENIGIAPLVRKMKSRKIFKKFVFSHLMACGMR